METVQVVGVIEDEGFALPVREVAGETAMAVVVTCGGKGGADCQLAHCSIYVEGLRLLEGQLAVLSLFFDRDVAISNVT